MSNSRRQHWEQVYQNKSDREVSWYQARPRLSLELIQRSGILPHEAIIDIGGGASTLVDTLLDLGYADLSVLDIAEQALLTAQQRLGRRAELVQWIQADITDFIPERHYRLWHDRAVFHFLTEPREREAYLAALHRGLQANGQLVIGAFALDGPQMCSGLPVQRYDAELLSRSLGEGFKLLDSRIETHHTPSGKLQEFGFYVYAKRG